MQLRSISSSVMRPLSSISLAASNISITRGLVAHLVRSPERLRTSYFTLLHTHTSYNASGIHVSLKLLRHACYQLDTSCMWAVGATASCSQSGSH